MIEDDYHAPDHPLACPRCGGYAGGELLCTRCEKAEDERLRTQAQQATRIPLRTCATCGIAEY